MKLLQDTEWSHWSDLEISRRSHVSNHFVRKLRDELAPVTRNIPSEPKTFTTKHGTVAKMNTAAIGKKPAGISMKVKGRRALRRRPLLATAASRVRFRCDSRPWGRVKLRNPESCAL